MAYPFNELQTLTLDHPGLVAAIARELGLVEKIDRRLPKTDRAKVSMGQRVLALVPNGLGFTRDRLYRVPRFFRGKPVDRLIGPGITAADLNETRWDGCSMRSPPTARRGCSASWRMRSARSEACWVASVGSTAPA